MFVWCNRPERPGVWWRFIWARNAGARVGQNASLRNRPRKGANTSSPEVLRRSFSGRRPGDGRAMAGRRPGDSTTTAEQLPGDGRTTAQRQPSNFRQTPFPAIPGEISLKFCYSLYSQHKTTRNLELPLLRCRFGGQLTKIAREAKTGRFRSFHRTRVPRPSEHRLTNRS